MKLKTSAAARLLLGLIYFVFGLNGFFLFLPIKPPPMSEKATGFIGGLAGSGYFMPVLSGTQAISGLLLLLGIAVPLMLVILAPITLQIFLFHVFLAPAMPYFILPLAMGILHIVAASAYWRIYRPLFFS